jgi:indolepyruvate ferredoxin oxidoreductase beta subunit
MDDISFLLAGVGGQGTLLASNILAQVGLQAGYDVKKSEVHGMAQRGGSVSSHVRWGAQVYSPLTGAGQVDVLVAFERLEALRYIDMLRPEGRVLVNDYVIVPVTVTTGNAVYPACQDILNGLHQVTPAVALVPGVAIARELGNARAGNVVLLGALARWLDLEREIWENVIAQYVPARYQDLNLVAFACGYEWAASQALFG